MFPVGAIFSLLGQGASGVMSILNNKRIQQASDANAAAERAELNAQINENPLSRSENQHLLGQYDREAQRQAEVARNMSVIKGATPEFSAAVQKGIAEGRANLMGDMAAGASGRADRLRRELRAVERNKYAEDQERRAQRNATYAALAGNAAGALGAIMDGYSAPDVPEEPVTRAPGVTPEEQADINARLSAIGEKVKDEKGLTAVPPIAYGYKR